MKEIKYYGNTFLQLEAEYVKAQLEVEEETKDNNSATIEMQSLANLGKAKNEYEDIANSYSEQMTLKYGKTNLGELGILTGFKTIYEHGVIEILALSASNGTVNNIRMEELAELIPNLEAPFD